MAVDRRAIVAVLRDGLPADLATDTDTDDETIRVAPIVRAWLADGPHGLTDDRAELEALCRQIDVRKRVSTQYDRQWKRRDPELAAAPGVVAAVAAALLGDADDRLTRHDDEGFALKCVNSALKALELYSDRGAVAAVPALRAWAIELLDRHTDGWEW